MDKYTFEDLKDEEVLVTFLERVWKAGLWTGKNTELTYENALRQYMPKFKERLSEA